MRAFDYYRDGPAAEPPYRMKEALPQRSGWFAEFRRRRMFRAMIAYFVGAWLLLQIANVTFPPLGLPDWMQRALIIALAVGVVPAFAIAWIYDLTAHGVVRTDAPAVTAAGHAAQQTKASVEPAQAAAVASSNAGVAGAPNSDDAEPGCDAAACAVASAPGPGDTSIAILPFTDLSPDRDQDWFCDGLAEEIIDALCCVRKLRVASRTASFRYRDGSVDPREIGRQLRVGAILEGSVRKAGERLRITVQLIDATSGFHLWSETYDRRLEDVFAIQSEIARKVSAALRVSLTGDFAARLERYAPRNMQAHEFYLRGRQLIGKINVTEWRQAPALFRRAIELDPDYAAAYAGLADVLTQLLLWRFARSEDVLPEARRAAHRALELAPELAEAHVALGHVRSLTGDNDGATRSFERALALNPELYEAHLHFGRHCLARGEYVRAAELLRSAFNIRPDDSTVLSLAVPALDAAGDRGAAEATAREAVVGLRHQLELNADDARAHYMLAGMLARLGQREAGKVHVETALRLRPNEYATLYNAACYYSQAGDAERAIELLERACELGGSREWFEHDSDLNPLRDHPHFQRMMDRLAGIGTAGDGNTG
jgi:adenylate cyclase